MTVKELLATKDKTIYLEQDTTNWHKIITVGGIEGTSGKHHPKKGPKVAQGKEVQEEIKRS